jgi:hypothetical protein
MRIPACLEVFDNLESACMNRDEDDFDFDD